MRNVRFPPIADISRLFNHDPMMVLALIAAQAAAASLRVGVGDGSEAIVQVIDDRRTGYRVKVDCVTRCVRPLHFATPIGEAPMGLVDLDRDGLIYSTWGTGCCYMVRVWKLTSGGVTKVLETGQSRAAIAHYDARAHSNHIHAADGCQRSRNK